jgi:hypothetical protein
MMFLGMIHDSKERWIFEEFDGFDLAKRMKEERKEGEVQLADSLFMSNEGLKLEASIRILDNP